MQTDSRRLLAAPQPASPDDVLPSTAPARSLLLWARAVLLGVALAYPVAFLLVAALRVPSPLPLDGLEYAIVRSVHRLLNGQSVYGAPTLGYVPLVYTPAYYYVSALVARVVGPGFLPLRLVSLASSLPSLGVIFALVRRETSSLRAATLAACLYAALFRAGGAYFDAARVDALFMLLLLAAMYALRAARRPAALAAAGALFGLAFFAKQPAIVIAAIMMVPLALDRGRAAWWAVAGCTAVMVPGFALLEWRSGGWFSYYTLQVALNQPMQPQRVVGFLKTAMLDPMPVAALAPMLFLARPVREAAGLSLSDVRFYAGGAAAMLAASLGSELVHGSFLNAGLPVHAWLCVIFGLAYHHLRRIGRRLGDHTSELALTAACLGQFALLAYPPWALAPGSDQPQDDERPGGDHARRGGAIRQAQCAQVFANSPLRYAEGDAVGDLMSRRLETGAALVRPPRAPPHLRRAQGRAGRHRRGPSRPAARHRRLRSPGALR